MKIFTSTLEPEVQMKTVVKAKTAVCLFEWMPSWRKESRYSDKGQLRTNIPTSIHNSYDLRTLMPSSSGFGLMVVWPKPPNSDSRSRFLACKFKYFMHMSI